MEHWGAARRRPWLLVFMTLSSIAVPAIGVAQRPPAAAKARIAVLDFEFAKSNQVAEREKVRTDLLTTKINTALVSSRRFDVVERQDLDRVLAEGKFSRTSFGDPAQAVRLGKLLSADYLVLGEISVMETRAGKTRVPYVERWKGEISGFMVLDVRVVNVRSGKIERAAKVEATLRQTVQVATAAETLAPSELFFEDLQREAAERTASKIVSSLYPVKISMFDTQTAYLNVGEGTGIQVGDLFIVQEVGDEIFDPDTGDSLGRVERPIAAIEVTAVEERRSKARGLGKQTPLRVGMICRQATTTEVEAFLQSSESGQ